jgi:hypothetical protein
MNREEAANRLNTAYDSIDRVFNELFFKHESQTAQDVTYLLSSVLDLIGQAQFMTERIFDETWQETP